MKTLKHAIALVAFTALTTSAAFADGHSVKPMIEAANQSVSNGTVSAAKVVAGENGWLVVHKTDDTRKPGPVVAHAPLQKGENVDVAAILTEKIKAGEKLMLMVHSEKGGVKTGIFEYTLGVKEDGPIKIDDKLVMTVITTE